MMIDKLKQLIEQASNRGYVRALKKNPGLLAWVMRASAGLPADAELAERVYVALHGVQTAFCDYGQHKGFNTLDKGFRFCAQGCRCRREEQARKITARQAAVTVKERKRRIIKQQATLLTRHGVRNPMDLPQSKIKARQTNRARYGGDHPMTSSVVRDKIKATNMSRLGVPYPGQSPAVQEKQRATNMARYQRQDTMHLARAAFAKQTGVANPFLLDIYQDKADQTMLERYGVRKALQNPTILTKMVAETQAKWGYPTVLMAPAIKQRIMETVQKNHNRRYVNQDHISDKSYAVLQDPDAFRAMFKTRSLREVAMELGLSYDGTRKYCDRYGVELPRSSYETALAHFLSDYAEVKRADRMIIKPYELDIVLPSYKIGIEFCGLYWHGEKFKAGPQYHIKKLDAANQAGYRLITIFEDEWVFQREIVKMRLSHILGQGVPGIGARKAQIKAISSTDALDFCNMYHMQGGGQRGFANYGAFHDGVLIAVMTFSRGRIVLGSSSQGPIELLRFATDGRRHPGIASRLFQAFVKEHRPDEVISYADRRWSEGGLYQILGFQRLGATDANYWYVHSNRLSREYRFKYRKDRIKHLVPDGDLKSEREIMTELGYYRIWDCGSWKFRWTA